MLTPVEDWCDKSTSFDRARALLEVAVMIRGGNSNDDYCGIINQVRHQHDLLKLQKISAEDYRQFQQLATTVITGLMEGLHWDKNAPEK